MRPVVASFTLTWTRRDAPTGRSGRAFTLISAPVDAERAFVRGIRGCVARQAERLTQLAGDAGGWKDEDL